MTLNGVENAEHRRNGLPEGLSLTLIVYVFKAIRCRNGMSFLSFWRTDYGIMLAQKSPALGLRGCLWKVFI